MSLPIILEIAIGLIFIYLTLSLIASEIQEILSALLQWRAEHLKHSIEQLLLSGNSPAGYTSRKSELQSNQQNRQAAKDLANRLYSSPLIENLNYEAQGRLAGAMRSIVHGIGALYRLLTFGRNVFDNKTSGPSYIPAETFASSLIECLGIGDVQQLLVRSRFSEFAESDVQRPLHNMLYELRAQLGQEDLLTAEIAYFDRELQQAQTDLGAQHITLESALQRLSLALQTFESMAADLPLLASSSSANVPSATASPTDPPTADLQASNAPTAAVPITNPQSTDLQSPNLQNANLQSAEQAAAQAFLTRVGYLRNSLNGNTPKTESVLIRIRPSLAELTALLDPNSPTYAELVALAQREGGAIWATLEKFQQEVIPPRLRESLATLGSRAERRITDRLQTTGTELQQFQAEIEDWFNQGMERASGVYRRNVKGVGILIGLAIAFTLNADTLYMLQRLSSDQAVRSSIVQAAEQLEIQGIDSADTVAKSLSIDELSESMESDLRSVGAAVEEALADYPLPIGRTQSVLLAQRQAEANWPIPWIPQRLVGWSITGLALSMGASFWFDLLRKVTSVRSTGDRPKS
jgi:hypothetical protein